MRALCLCMIVRDEAAVIERLLRTVRPLVDTWVICDTGSTDGTQDVIRAAMQGVEGELHERPWVDFGHNRSELLALAHGRAERLLLLDADMEVEQLGALPDLGAEPDALLLRHAGAVEYWTPRVLRGDVRWRYEGVTHEYLASDVDHTTGKLHALVLHHHADGGSRADKFERDERLLRGALDRDPEDARSVFYLAQTLRDAGRTDEAIALYDRRARMGGWPEEAFYARFQVGVLRAEQGAWPEAMASLVAAWQLRPWRMEPVYELASRLRLRGEHHAAHAFAVQGVDRPVSEDWLFVAPWVHRYGLLVELSITAFQIGAIEESRDACERLLALDDLPAGYRQSTERNLQLCRDRLARAR